MITIDFRFNDINFELWALDQYLDFMERHLPILTETERERILSEAYSQSSSIDDLEVQYAHQVADSTEENIIPRHFRAPYLISLWGVFEAAVKEITNYIRNKENQTLGVNDLRGDFLTQIKKYYENIIQYEFSLDSNIWIQLEIIALVRHAFAHGNGRKGAVNETTWRKIEKWMECNEGLTIDNDYLIPSKEFIRNSYSLIFSTIDDLSNRVKSGYSS